MQLLRTCRFCGGVNSTDHLLKYGTRAYAHFGCFRQNKTPGILQKLPEHERNKFAAWRAREKLIKEELIADFKAVCAAGEHK